MKVAKIWIHIQNGAEPNARIYVKIGEMGPLGHFVYMRYNAFDIWACEKLAN